MRKYFLSPLVALALLLSCSSKKQIEQLNDTELHQLADQLAHKFLIIDGHVDFPERLKDLKKVITEETKSIAISDTGGEFDYERAKKGGLTAPFMSIYIPSSYQKQNDMGKVLADSLIDKVRAIATLLPDKFALVTSTADLKKNFEAGLISLPMGMENGAPFGNDLKNVKYFYDRGIRYTTLTHSKNNQICDSSGDSAKWNGLSPFGKEVVKEMNRVGIMVDISHVDDSTFYQVMKLTNVPCIASHSSCRAFAPTVRRDMTDDMIKLMGKNNGVILVNFYNAFLDSSVVNHNKKLKEVLEKLLEERRLSLKDTAAQKFIKEFYTQNPLKRTDIEMVANHIDHIKSLAGIDHVGFGSDFDGVDGQTPTGLEDASKYPDLIYSLLKRGYTEEDIEKICYKNALRVWSAVEAKAKELQNQ
jgi:membrane dipeptidase